MSRRTSSSISFTALTTFAVACSPGDGVPPLPQAVARDSAGIAIVENPPLPPRPR